MSEETITDTLPGKGGFEAEMKIAHVLTRFSPEENPGGVERVVEELAERQSEDHEVEIICRNQFDDPKEENYKGIKVKRGSTLDVSGLRTPSSLFSMRKLIKESEADIFHIHDWSPYLNYIAAEEPENSVLTMHNLSEGLGSHFEGLAAKRADQATCVSSWLSEKISEKHGVETETVNDGVNLERFSNEDSEGFALFVGNLSNRKGVPELNEAFSNISKEIKYVGKQIVEVNETDNQEFLGRISDEELESLYSRCEYVVLPSKKEGFGLVWAEAMASGKPVIFTETGIGADIPEYCGVELPKEFEEEDIRISVEEIEINSYDSEEIRNFAQENFDWSSISEHYVQVYRSI